MTNKPSVAPYKPPPSSQPDRLVDLLTSTEIKREVHPVQGKPPTRPKSEMILEPTRLPSDTKVSKPIGTPSPAPPSESRITLPVKKTMSSLAYSSASAGDTEQGSISQVDTKVAKPVQLVPQAQPIQPEGESRPASGSIGTSKHASVQFTVGVSSMSSWSESLSGVSSAAGVSSSAAGMSASADVSSSTTGMPTAAGSLAPSIKYTMLYDFTAGDPTELTVREGSVVMSATSSDAASPGWVMVELDGEKGWVPESYLKVMEVAPVSSVTENHREEKGWWCASQSLEILCVMYENLSVSYLDFQSRNIFRTNSKCTLKNLFTFLHAFR